MLLQPTIEVSRGNDADHCLQLDGDSDYSQSNRGLGVFVS